MGILYGLSIPRHTQARQFHASNYTDNDEWPVILSGTSSVYANLRQQTFIHDHAAGVAYGAIILAVYFKTIVIQVSDFSIAVLHILDNECHV